MPDRPESRPKVVKRAQALLVLSEPASAQAPFIYFEGAPAYGNLDGVIRITLEASRLISASDGAVSVERVIVAHLRMSRAGARSLRNAIDGALLLASPAASEAQN